MLNMPFGQTGNPLHFLPLITDCPPSQNTKAPYPIQAVLWTDTNGDNLQICQNE